MSMKRVLGMMLASRMAGRGRGRGGLGSALMMGALGRRRRGMGGRLGMAALGVMAYRAYQDHQARTGGSAGGGSAAGQGGIGGMLRDVADRISGGAASGSDQRAGASTPSAEDERAAEQFSEDRALLLIRAMVTAAYSDGALSQDERARILGQLDHSGADPEDRRIMEREIANPRPLDELLGQVRDQETSEEFYLASRAAIDGNTDANRSYLATLRQRLGLSEEDAAEVDQMVS